MLLNIERKYKRPVCKLVTDGLLAVVAKAGVFKFLLSSFLCFSGAPNLVNLYDSTSCGPSSEPSKLEILQIKRSFNKIDYHKNKTK